MGGVESRGIEEWPWQAGLWQVQGKQAGFLCGATLIYDQWAITAAHCVTRERTNQVQCEEKRAGRCLGCTFLLRERDEL